MLDASAPHAAPVQPPHATRHRDCIALARARRGRSDASDGSGSEQPSESDITPNAPTQARVAAEMLAVEVIPPRQTTREAVALETGMAALAHALDKPIALELAGAPEARRFVARAVDGTTLAQVVSQLRARYPQAIIRPLPPNEDALRLAPGEAVSALELYPGAAPYLPLRTPAERELAQEGADPLLGLVAAFGALRPGMRAVAQLALAPARDGWSAPHQRLALEHPLEPERARERWELATARMDPAAGVGAELGLPAVVGLLALLGLAVVVQWNASRFPQWLRADALALLHRHVVHLTTAQTLWLAGWAGGSLALLVAAQLAGAWIRGRLRAWRHPTQLYDPLLVRDKTARVAYHARLRVLVIGPTHASARPAPRQTSMLTRENLQQAASCAEAGFAAAIGEDPAPAQAWNHQRIRPHLTAILRTFRSGAKRRLRSTLLVRVAVGIRRHTSSPSGCLRLIRRYGRTWLRACRRAWREQVQARHDARQQANLRREALDSFIGAYRQFHLATGAYFRPRRLSFHTARWITITAPDRRLRRRSAPPNRWARSLARSTHLLSVAEVAALWHLPQASDLADLPFVERSRARTLLAPASLARPMSAVRIGTSSHAGQTLPIYLSTDAMRRNMLAIAKTGKGKSTLLLALARATLADTDGSGLVLLDPHGDLADTVLTLIPDHRREDVLLVDLSDRLRPIGLNLLDVTLFLDRDKAVSNMIAVFSQIWKDFWGPRMESAIEAALKTLYEANQAIVAADPQDGPDRQYTLLDATPLLTFSAFRHSLMSQIYDAALTEYWLRFEALQPRLQQDIITPVTTKLDKFANSFIARRIVGQGRSTLNITEAVQRGRIVLLNTARGIVGHDTAALIGATLLGLLHVTLAEQAQLPPAARRRVRVLVDEFQVLEGVDFGAMLAELRKFGASFALATQALAHLDALARTLRPTVMANVDQLFCFAMSADDARLVERELDGVVNTTDLTTLDDFSCYARLTQQGQRVPVFSLALDAPVPPTVEQRAQADALRRRSQRFIGREVRTVDALIARAALRRKAVAEQPRQQSRHGVAADHSDDQAQDEEQGHQRHVNPRGRATTGNAPMAMTRGRSAEESLADPRSNLSGDPATQAIQEMAPGDGIAGAYHTRGTTRSHWRHTTRTSKAEGVPKELREVSTHTPARHPNDPPFVSLLLTAAGQQTDQSDEPYTQDMPILRAPGGEDEEHPDAGAGRAVHGPATGGDGTHPLDNDVRADEDRDGAWGQADVDGDGDGDGDARQ